MGSKGSETIEKLKREYATTFEIVDIGLIDLYLDLKVE